MICREIVLAELARAGIRNAEIVRGAKHEQVRWSVNGHTPRILTIPGTPSDHRTPANVRADVRRALRADGVIVDHAPKPKPTPSPRDRMSILEQRVRALELKVSEITLPSTVPRETLNQTERERHLAQTRKVISNEHHPITDC
jgi:hypothetical protein